MSKKKKMSIIILIICVLLCGIIAYFNIPMKIVEKNLNKINDENEIDGNGMYPQNLYLSFEEYIGDVKATVVSKDFEFYFQKMIPKYYKKCKNMSDEDMVKYFDKNKDLILKELGTDNVTDFKKIIKRVIQLNGNKLELTSYEVIKGTTSFVGKKSLGTMKAIYNENQEVYMNFEIKKDNFSYEHPVKLIGDVDINNVKEIEEINKQNVENEIQYNVTGKIID